MIKYWPLSQSEPINDENNNEPSKSDDLKAKDKKDEKSDELPMSEVEVLRDQVNRLNNENSFLRDQLKLYQTCRICKDMLEWNEKRVALSCGHIFWFVVFSVFFWKFSIMVMGFTESYASIIVLKSPYLKPLCKQIKMFFTSYIDYCLFKS